MSRIQKSTIDFLRQLAKNNDREWFNANKPTYEKARENVAEFAQSLMDRINQDDLLETQNGKKSLFRIYRDVRFSKNKAPYKTSLSGRFRREGKLRRGGYYYHLEPGDFVIGGGFYGMEKHDLKRMRQELDQDGDTLRGIMAAPAFKEQFGVMRGEQLKTAPQGYPKDHENIDLLRYKQFYAFRNFTEKEVLSAGFLDEAHAAVVALRPFFDYFTDVLTTDANGELMV
ncbi:TIGR02453 family protein [Lewinellaceae bacterium SD302]|nr:TIGR02453 family protein [Lewinellaceae bacterium SD302]